MKGGKKKKKMNRQKLLERYSKMNKKGQFQIAGSLINGIVGFVLACIVGLIVIGLLVGGNFFASTSAEQGALNNISSNVTAGINQISAKLPTIFTIVVMVIVLSFIALIYLVWKGKSGGGNFGQ